MFEELLNKTVKCREVGLLQFMYPNFRIIREKYELKTYGNAPFIYAGSGLYLDDVKKCSAPHIVVSSSGDYDLDDRETLLDLAYSKHNKKRPSNFHSWQFMSADTFLYIWKQFWVLGELSLDDEKISNVFIQLLEFISCPYMFFKSFYQVCNESNVDRLEEVIINFMICSLNDDWDSKSNSFIVKKGKIFKSLYQKNIFKAINKHLYDCEYIKNPVLRLYLLLFNILSGCDCSYEFNTYYSNYNSKHLINVEHVITEEEIEEYRKYISGNLKLYKENMTTIILGKLGCKLFKEMCDHEIHSLETIEDVNNFIGTYDFATDEVLIFENLSYMEPVARGALLKFLEEPKRPIIALCSKDDISGAMMSRFLCKIKVEEPIVITEMPICEFIKLKNRLKHKNMANGKSHYTENELLIIEDFEAACLKLCHIYFYIAKDFEYYDGKLLDEKIYLMFYGR